MKKRINFLKRILWPCVLVIFLMILGGCSSSSDTQTQTEMQTVEETSADVVTEAVEETSGEAEKSVDVQAIRECLAGNWHDESGACQATFYEGGNSELTFATTLTHYEILADGTIQLSDRYGDTTSYQVSEDKKTALESSKWYYVDQESLVIDKKEFTKQ